MYRQPWNIFIRICPDIGLWLCNMCKWTWITSGNGIQQQQPGTGPYIKCYKPGNVGQEELELSAISHRLPKSSIYGHGDWPWTASERLLEHNRRWSVCNLSKLFNQFIGRNGRGLLHFKLQYLLSGQMAGDFPNSRTRALALSDCSLGNTSFC